MRDNEIVGLWEAYLQVHQPKEEVEQLDEDFPKQVGDFLKRGGDVIRKIPGVAAALSPVRGNKGKGTVTADQQKAKIKPVGEEVENWVNSLIDEGYDLSEYTWEDMYEMYVNLDEEYDTFDAILEHLVAEGYADTNESALVIMANMSEEWREEIVEKADNTIRLVYGKGGKGVPIRGSSGYVLREPKVGFAQQGRDFSMATDQAAGREHLRSEKKKRKDRINSSRYDKALKQGIERATNRSDREEEGEDYSYGLEPFANRNARRRRASGR